MSASVPLVAGSGLAGSIGGGVAESIALKAGASKEGAQNWGLLGAMASGAAVGALIGAPTGVGAPIGAVGGAVFGAMGYLLSK